MSQHCILHDIRLFIRTSQRKTPSTRVRVAEWPCLREAMPQKLGDGMICQEGGRAVHVSIHAAEKNHQPAHAPVLLYITNS